MRRWAVEDILYTAGWLFGLLMVGAFEACVILYLVEDNGKTPANKALAFAMAQAVVTVVAFAASVVMRERKERARVQETRRRPLS